MSSSSSLDEALRLECHILNLVLQRNHKQHFRTQYFRRIEMMERSIRKHSILSTWISDMATLSQTAGSHSNSTLIMVVRRIYNTVTIALPEIISRIYHAAAALFMELSKGYFVPLCSVLLAIISRIRVILMRLGREAIGLLQQQPSLLMVIHTDLSFISWNTLLQPFVEIDGPTFQKWKRTFMTASSLVTHTPPTLSRSDISTTKTVQESQENNFIEEEEDIGQDYFIQRKQSSMTRHSLYKQGKQQESEMNSTHPSTKHKPHSKREATTSCSRKQSSSPMETTMMKQQHKQQQPQLPQQLQSFTSTGMTMKKDDITPSSIKKEDSRMEETTSRKKKRRKKNKDTLLDHIFD